MKVSLGLLSLLFQGAQGCLILPSVRGQREGVRVQASLLKWRVNINPNHWQESRPRERRGSPVRGVCAEGPQGGGAPVNVFVEVLRAGRCWLKKTGLNLSSLQAFSVFKHLIRCQVCTAPLYLLVQEKPEYRLRFQKSLFSVQDPGITRQTQLLNMQQEKGGKLKLE